MRLVILGFGNLTLQLTHAGVSKDDCQHFFSPQLSDKYRASEDLFSVIDTNGMTSQV